jgi:hypothetical protein
MSVAIEAVFQNLVDKFRAAREAFECLRLTAVEDRPLHNEILLIERLGNAVEDLQGWLEEGAAAAGNAWHAVRHPLDGYHARAALTLANERFIQVEYKFLCEHLSYEEISELTVFGRRRGREWLGWTGTVIQAFSQCRAPLRDVDAALLLCWQELSERLTAGALSIHTTNIGQQISESVSERADGRLRADWPSSTA